MNVRISRSGLAALKATEQILRFVTDRSDLEIYDISFLQIDLPSQSRNVALEGRFACGISLLSFSVSFRLVSDEKANWVIGQGDRDIYYHSEVTHNYNDGIRLHLIDAKDKLAVSPGSADLLKCYREYLATFMKPSA